MALWPPLPQQEHHQSLIMNPVVPSSLPPEAIRRSTPPIACWIAPSSIRAIPRSTADSQAAAEASAPDLWRSLECSSGSIELRRGATYGAGSKPSSGSSASDSSPLGCAMRMCEYPAGGLFGSSGEITGSTNFHKGGCRKIPFQRADCSSRRPRRFHPQELAKVREPLSPCAVCSPIHGIGPPRRGDPQGFGPPRIPPNRRAEARIGAPIPGT